MCEPTAIAIVASSVIGAVAGSLNKPDTPDKPATTQEAKLPDEGLLGGPTNPNQGAGVGAGAGGTLLSGARGAGARQRRVCGEWC